MKWGGSGDARCTGLKGGHRGVGGRDNATHAVRGRERGGWSAARGEEEEERFAPGTSLRASRSPPVASPFSFPSSRLRLGCAPPHGRDEARVREEGFGRVTPRRGRASERAKMAVAPRGGFDPLEDVSGGPRRVTVGREPWMDAMEADLDVTERRVPPTLPGSTAQGGSPPAKPRYRAGDGDDDDIPEVGPKPRRSSLELAPIGHHHHARGPRIAAGAGAPGIPEERPGDADGIEELESFHSDDGEARDQVEPLPGRFDHGYGPADGGGAAGDPPSSTSINQTLNGAPGGDPKRLTWSDQRGFALCEVRRSQRKLAPERSPPTRPARPRARAARRATTTPRVAIPVQHSRAIRAPPVRKGRRRLVARANESALCPRRCLERPRRPRPAPLLPSRVTPPPHAVIHCTATPLRMGGERPRACPSRAPREPRPPLLSPSSRPRSRPAAGPRRCTTPTNCTTPSRCRWTRCRSSPPAAPSRDARRTPGSVFARRGGVRGLWCNVVH